MIIDCLGVYTRSTSTCQLPVAYLPRTLLLLRHVTVLSLSLTKHRTSILTTKYRTIVIAILGFIQETRAPPTTSTQISVRETTSDYGDHVRRRFGSHSEDVKS